MKAVVLFDSKHGTSLEAAEAVASGLRSCGAAVNVVKIGRERMDCSGADLVVVGGPVYFGTWSKRAASELRRLAACSDAETGRSVRVACFSVGMMKDGASRLAASFLSGFEPLAAAGFGGKLAAGRLSLFERLVTKAVTGSGVETAAFDPSAAAAFGRNLFALAGGV